MSLPKIDMSIFPELQIKENIKFNVGGLKEWGETLVSDPAKALRWFWKGKELGTEMRLGDLYEDKTGLYKHREWRGFKDTFYYFNAIWLYNYGCAVKAILTSEDPIATLKGVFRYRWLGQDYLTVMHWFDRGLEGTRGDALKASGWAYNGMVLETIRQFCRLCAADANLHGGKRNKYWYNTFAHDETVAGAIFYPWRDQGFDAVSLQMVPYFVGVHVNSQVVLNYIDAMQSIGLPGDPCPMCQAESGIFVLDDVPDYSPLCIVTNEACDDSVGTSITTDWFYDRPMFAMPQPMQFDDPLVQEHCANEIQMAWDFIEDQVGVPYSEESFVKYIKLQNILQEHEREKWEVAAKTSSYPLTGTAQALFRIYYSQSGWRKHWADNDERIMKIVKRCVEKKTDTFPLCRHRALAWSCAPLFYSHWCAWAYNTWGIVAVINMDSLMFDVVIRTDTHEHLMEDFALWNEWAPMRRMAVGGYKHIFECWENYERFNCDMVMMYDQLQCKGMTGIHGMFEDEFRNRNIPAIWMPHSLPDRRIVNRAEIRSIINDYMTTVMGEDPIDPSLLEFDDTQGW